MPDIIFPSLDLWNEVDIQRINNDTWEDDVRGASYGTDWDDDYTVGTGILCERYNSGRDEYLKLRRAFFQFD